MKLRLFERRTGLFKDNPEDCYPPVLQYFCPEKGWVDVKAGRETMQEAQQRGMR